MTAADLPDLDGRLERRYRWLLRSYPAAHQVVYGEEMLTVLMTGAVPGQRHPNPREALSVVTGGFAARLRAPLRAVRGPAWADAAGLFGFLTCVLIAAFYVYRVADWVGWAHILEPGPVPRTAMVVAAVWTVAATAAGLGWRRAASLVAAIGTVGLVVTIVRSIGFSFIDAPWGEVVLAVTAVLSLGLMTPGTRPGRRVRVAVPLAALLVCVAGLVEPLTLKVTVVDGGEYQVGPRLSTPSLPLLDEGPLFAVTMLALIVALGSALVRLRPATRRRVLTLAFPALATVLVRVALLGPTDPWFALVVFAPIAGAVLAVAVLARLERGQLEPSGDDGCAQSQ